MRRHRLCLLGLVTLACSPAAPPALDDTGGSFQLGAAPLLVLGVSHGDPLLTFDMVQDARRLSDGTLLVVDGGTRQLRWFAPDGTPVRHTGRRGAGPGEYQGSLSLLAWAGDSIAVIDREQNRVTILGDTVRVARVLARTDPEAAALPWRPWLARRTVVFNAATPERAACVRAALRAMPQHPLEEGVRFLTMDDAGRLWLREGADSAGRWSLWRQDGTPLGRAELPPTFHLLQATATEVIGRVEADDASERVVVLPITDQRDGGACLPADSLDAVPEVERSLMAHTRNLFVVQEAMYADGATYAMVPDPTLIRLPESVRYWMREATRSGYVGGIIDHATGQACITSVGRTSVTGWPDGVIVCGGG